VIAAVTDVPSVDPTIIRLAKNDASVDELRGRFDGARSAFMRRRVLAEVHWPVYRTAYESAMARFVETARHLNALRSAGAL
jgi:hypothetical protein